MKRFARTINAALLLGSISASLAFAAPTAHGQSRQVEASVADFPILVNGVTVDTAHAAYPPLVYRDITYLPLTWDMARALQWETAWTDSDGLSVRQAYTARGGGAYGYAKSPLQQTTAAVNRPGQHHSAATVVYPVQIGQQTIDNETEPYPLLTFRDVTYMPLTWKFAHELLGADLQWSERDGLSVQTPQQPVLRQIAFDDAEYLYIYPELATRSGYSMLKLHKSLAGKPVWITEQEAAAARPPYEQQSLIYPELKGAADESDHIRLDGEQVWYDSIRLDIDPNADFPGSAKSSWGYAALTLPLGDGQKLVSIRTAERTNAVSVRRMPYRAHLFLVRGEAATKLAGYKDVPQRVSVNEDGSRWISANIDRRGDMRDYYYRYAQLALLGKDGGYRLVNELFGNKHINVLAISGDTVIFDTFEPSDTLPSASKPGGAIYSIDTGLHIKLLYEYESGLPYADAQQRLFILDPAANAVTGVSSGTTVRWWDYELIGPGDPQP